MRNNNWREFKGKLKMNINFNQRYIFETVLFYNMNHDCAEPTFLKTRKRNAEFVFKSAERGCGMRNSLKKARNAEFIRKHAERGCRMQKHRKMRNAEQN